MAWLEAERARVNTDSAKMIDLLKDNLLVDQISVENNNRFIIVPLKDDFKTANETSLATFKKLVLTENNDETFTGSIIELIPRGQHTKPGLNISLLINKQAADFTGISSNLSIYGKFVSEDVYKDGKLYSTTRLISKAKTKKGSDTSHVSTLNMSLITCLDWYIITTVYNYDGSVNSVSYEYIGSTCTGFPPPCSTQRIITETKSSFRIGCDDGGGGGGGGDGGGGGNDDSYVNPTVFIFDPADGILLNKMLDCFNRVANASGTTYKMTISSDLPENDHPDHLVTLGAAPRHSFITLEKSDGTTTVTKSFGFYPVQGWSSIFMQPVPSQIEDNFDHEANGTVQTSVTGVQFDASIAQAMNLASNKYYDLNNYNSTNFALDIWNSAHPSNQINVPDWVTPAGINYGKTPNGLWYAMQNGQVTGSKQFGTTNAASTPGVCE